MRVLVTGATGFVGSAVVRALRRHGHTVVALVRNPEKARPLQDGGVELAVGDMWRPESYQHLATRAEAVIHAAQEPLQGRWTRRKIAAMHRSDALMTRTLAGACLAQGKLLLYSSGSLTHAGFGDAWIDETMPSQPCRVARGHAEMIAELMALHRERGLRVVVPSPGFVYGAGGLLKMTVELLRGKRYRIIGDGQNYWSLVHVDDVGEAYALALERGRPGQCYFLSDGAPMRRREVIGRVCDALGLARVGRVPGCLIGLFLGFPLVEAVNVSQRLRNDKAMSELGWKPRYATFLDGLPDALRTLSSHDRTRAISP